MTLPPLRRQVLVGCDQSTAYRLFLAEIGSWWPLATHGCFGAGGSLVFDGERIVETGPDGDVAIWGTVVARDDPRAVTFTWHPGRTAEAATEVTVTFTPTGDPASTLVTLQHSGWEIHADPDAARGEYADGWVTVLEHYADGGTASDAVAVDLWLILEHRPGPAAPAAGIFSSPDFGRHLEFLDRLHEQGLLVAGGPLPDAPGAGMTIVRAASADAARRVVRAAQVEDGSVAAGLLDVRIRPWRVAMTGGD